MMGTNTDSDTCMDILPDVPPVEAAVAVAPSHVGRGRELRPSQDLETPESIMEFFRLLGRPGSRRHHHHHHRHCPARRPDASLLYLDAPNPENVTDSAQAQTAARGRQSLVWFIPNEPRMRLPQDGLARRDSGPGESSNPLRICKRHGNLVGKHSHIPRSHQVHVHRPRGRSCPPDPVGQGQGHGSGRPPQRPTRIWIPSKRLFRSQRLWFPGRLGMAPLVLCLTLQAMIRLRLPLKRTHEPCNLCVYNLMHLKSQAPQLWQVNYRHSYVLGPTGGRSCSVVSWFVDPSPCTRDAESWRCT